jgi:diguanylate cyclase (GGDEF)-like protein
MDRAEQAILQAARRSSSIAVLLVDVDDFEEINCSLGHEAGDQLLAIVSERLKASVGPEGTVARLGCDEFPILLDYVPNENAAVSAAERIQKALEAPLRLDGTEVLISVSVGISIGSSEQDEPEGLLREAYVAMRVAKKKGKARHKMFDRDGNTTTSKRSLAESEMRRAIKEEEFQVYYQPQVALDSEKICGVEALMRWQHPVYGMIPPNDFIPLAEQTGLITHLGRWILREACRQVRLWQEERPSDPPLMLSVNVSACQFRQPNLAKEILRTLEETGLKPGHLKLEITESVMMHDVPTIGTLQELKGAGSELVMDDFGTGYSNLSYLKRLPIDSLKIDRSYISGLGSDAGDTAIVHATIAFARALGLNITAEGIQNTQQLAELKELGCELGQGYHFAKPLPKDEVAQLLSTGSLQGSSGEQRTLASEQK